MGGDVHQAYVVEVSLEDAAEDRGAEADDFVGIDGFLELLDLEDLFGNLLDLRDACGATDHDDVCDAPAPESRGESDLLAAGAHLVEEVDADGDEGLAGECELEVLGAAAVNTDERQHDLGFEAL